MKKILRQGVDLSNLDKENYERVLHCPRCGCIFSALYQDAEYRDGGVMRYYTCPNETCKYLMEYQEGKVYYKL